MKAKSAAKLQPPLCFCLFVLCAKHHSFITTQFSLHVYILLAASAALGIDFFFPLQTTPVAEELMTEFTLCY